MTDETEENKEKQAPASGAGLTPPMAPMKPSPSGVTEIYSNFLGFSWTQYDVRIRFAQVIPARENAAVHEFVAEERAAITLAWAHAKGLLMILQELVKSYEKVNGQIVPLKMPTPE